MGVVVSIVNQKGGVSKSTMAVNEAAILAERGLRVLLVDMDPQANATSYFQMEGSTYKPDQTAYALFQPALAKRPDIIHHTRIARLDVVPSSNDLASISWAVGNLIERDRRLPRFISEVRDDYDVIFIDTQPDISTYTLNAILCSDYLLVPMQPERLAVNGFTHLSRVVDQISAVNDSLSFLGVVITLFDGRTKSHKEWREVIKEKFGHQCLGLIHLASAVREASDRGKTIGEHHKANRAYQEHLALAKTIQERLGL